ncbi:MAG: hypothetical protein EB084_25585, partial [Proteobacteria bacterium]|nr:hypothetical protein [Pseudomonadota bacterium]
MPHAGPRYRPRVAHQTPLYELALDHAERFEHVYDERYASQYGPWRPRVGKTLMQYLDCGVPSNGMLRVACTTDGCRYSFFVPFSCKRAICPSCAQRRSLEFSEFVNAAVLEPVAYRHVVFTIPKMLRSAFLRDGKMLRELGRCAWKVLRHGLATAAGDAMAVPGALLSRATAGDLMNPHPHLHAIVSCGAWSDGGRGESFLPWPPHLTGGRLEALFQREVLRMMVKRERLAPETAQRLMGWNPTGFSVWVGDPIEPEQTLSRLRLARYITKGPVALERMEYDNQNCLVHYRSFAQGRSRTATALDFLADLSVHVPDRGQHGVSYFGRHSSRSRGERRKAQLAPTDSSLTTRMQPPPPPSRKAFRIVWARLLQKVWRVDVLRCPRCGGRARVTAAVVN